MELLRRFTWPVWEPFAPPHLPSHATTFTLPVCATVHKNNGSKHGRQFVGVTQCAISITAWQHCSLLCSGADKKFPHPKEKSCLSSGRRKIISVPPPPCFAALQAMVLLGMKCCSCELCFVLDRNEMFSLFTSVCYTGNMISDYITWAIAIQIICPDIKQQGKETHPRNLWYNFKYVYEYFHACNYPV